MAKLGAFLKAQPVLCISFLAAVVTAFIIPPDRAYLGYCNYTVLIELFALMTAVAGLRSAGLFERATDVLLRKAGNVRRLGLIFLLLTFFAAMLVTNDVALLTFVPLTLLVWERIGDEKSRILTIVLETAAANLGSMLTPVGNPQNLYLYDAFSFSAMDFLRLMLPLGLVGLICLLALTLLLPKPPCTAPAGGAASIDRGRMLAFGALFVVCLLAVLRVLNVFVLLGIAVILPLLFDRSCLRRVDYALLATFVCFFVFVGNISRMEAVQTFVSDMLTGRELIVSALLSQVISNVPAAVMLAGFTQNGSALLLGVDIGGFGTIIASLASLISFQIYRTAQGTKPGRYMLVFTGVNVLMLALLLGVAYLFPIA